jgi:hypothetical protein
MPDPDAPLPPGAAAAVALAAAVERVLADAREAALSQDIEGAPADDTATALSRVDRGPALIAAAIAEAASTIAASIDRLALSVADLAGLAGLAPGPGPSASPDSPDLNLPDLPDLALPDGSPEASPPAPGPTGPSASPDSPALALTLTVPDGRPEAPPPAPAQPVARVVLELSRGGARVLAAGLERDGDTYPVPGQRRSTLSFRIACPPPDAAPGFLAEVLARLVGSRTEVPGMTYNLAWPEEGEPALFSEPLTREEAAARSGRSIGAVARAVTQGRLPVSAQAGESGRVGLSVSAADLKAWLAASAPAAK